VTHSLLNQASAGRHLLEVEEGDELAGVTLAVAVLDNGNSEGREEGKASELGELGLLAGEDAVGSHLEGLLLEETVTGPGGGVEDGHVAALGLEDLGQLLVVRDHHRRLLCLLARRVGKQALDVLNRAEGLLPKLELDRERELGEARLNVPGKDVGVREVDRVALVGVLVNGRQVLADHLAQPAELGLALVVLAEGKGLLDDVLWDGRERSARTSHGEVESAAATVERAGPSAPHLVDDLEPGAVAKRLEADAEALPVEAERGQDNLSVGPALLSVNRHHQERRRVERGVEVDLLLVIGGGASRTRLGGVLGERLGRERLGLVNLGEGGGEELADDRLDRRDIRGLGDVAAGRRGDGTGQGVV
jgi:hypothetical protein